MDARVKLSLPLVALDPDHAPEAVQLEAFVEDQEIVTAELTEAEEDEEEIMTVAAGVGVGVSPPPWQLSKQPKPNSEKHHLSAGKLLCNNLSITASPGITMIS